MLATNHEAIYDRWSATLQRGLERIHSPAGPYCVYLGNWIADMSQVYDPAVAEFVLQCAGSPKMLAGKLQAFASDILWKLEALGKAGRLLGVETALLDDLKEVSTDARKHVKELKQARDVPNLRVSGPEAFGSTMELVYTIMQLQCLSRFGGKAVEPKKISATEVYALFNEHFGTYMPHQHLDRPLAYDLVKGASPTEIKAKFASFVTSDPGPADIGMKGYLHDAITVASGFLNSLSLRSPLTLENADLVKLGFTLHVLEDYFAHSNFLERLIVSNSSLDDEWIEAFTPSERAKLVTSNTSMEAIPPGQRPQTAFEFIHLPKDFTGQFEPQVVTGFFGPTDVYHSLLHAISEQVARFWAFTPPQTSAPPIDPVGSVLTKADEVIAEPPQPPTDFLDAFEAMLIAKPLEVVRERAKARARGETPKPFGRGVRERMNDSDVRAKVDAAGVPLQIYPEIADRCADHLARLIGPLSGTGGDEAGEQRLERLLVLAQAGASLLRLLSSAKAAVGEVLAEVKRLALQYPRIAGLVEAAFELGGAASAKALTRLEKALLTEPEIGSHSAIAKDERQEQPTLYQHGETFAATIDTLVLNTLFGLDPGSEQDPSPDPADEGVSDESDPADQAEVPEALPPVRWDTTLLELLRDPICVYGQPKYDLVKLRQVEVVEVKSQTLTEVINRGFLTSGFTAFEDYLGMLAALNPEIECEGVQFRLRPGSATSAIVIPLAKPRAVQGLLAMAPVVALDDWRRELYFEGKASLQSFVRRGARPEIEEAIGRAIDTRRRLVDDYESVLRHLFPDLQTLTLRQGYYGVGAGS